MKLVIPFLIFMFFGCSNVKLDAKEYVNWYSANENLLSVKTNSAFAEYKLTYLPNEVVVSNCFLKNCLGIDTLNQAIQDYNSLEFKLYITTLTVGKDLFSNFPDSRIPESKRMEYYSFNIKEDIKLVKENNDTLKPSVVFFEPGYARSGRGYFELEFKNVHLNEVSSILLMDKAISNSLQFFSLENIKKNELPKLKLK